MTENSTGVLSPPALRPLPLGRLRPAGWLRRQLELQAAGMAGHLDEIWPDVADSAWIGGSADGWERAPYWLDGLVPLSALLDDDRLAKKVERWIGYLLEHQQADGWMGPDDPDPDVNHATRFGPYDVWPRIVVLKALLQHHSESLDPQTVEAALRLCRRIDQILDQWPLYEWGRVRWADLVYCLDALADLTDESWLLDVSTRVRRQGFDWVGYAERLPFGEKVSDAMLQRFRSEADGVWMNDRHLSSHGVNVAMALKAFPVWSRHEDASRAEAQRAAFERLLAQLDARHGQATGLFTCDEHLAGPSPSQGTETCAVVEYLFSLAVALETWGYDEAIVDRWERLAFNALPASARADECGHQYDQLANQVVCHVTEDRTYTNNGPDANVFGLAPHFGCCTANRHQGWPKFAARLWMSGDDGGLTALSYAPCRLDTTVNDHEVRIEVTGDYPFTDRVEIAISAEGDGSARFPISLRIPGWAEGATLSLDGGQPSQVAAGSTVRLGHDWSGRHTVQLVLPARLRTQLRTNDAITVTRGPVVFALAVPEEWRQIGGVEPYGTWEVHPLDAWNYSLEVDPHDPEKSLATSARAADGLVFTTADAPIRLVGRATLLPQWTLLHGAADTPPPSPCEGTGPARDVVLLPYGAARLRVTELPWHAPRQE